MTTLYLRHTIDTHVDAYQMHFFQIFLHWLPEGKEVVPRGDVTSIVGTDKPVAPGFRHKLKQNGTQVKI